MVINVLKHTKKIVVLCLTVTVLNIAYVLTNGNLVEVINKNAVKDIVANYTVVGYHHDWLSNFMVLQKLPKEADDAIVAKSDTKDAYRFWQFMQADVKGAALDYDVRFVNGYDYATDAAAETALLSQPFSDTQRAEHDMMFLNVFRHFFEQLLHVIKECEPSIPEINNDAHYAVANEDELYPHLKGRIAVYGGHLRENYLDEPVRTKEMLAHFLRLSPQETSDLAGSHAKFLERMPTSFPNDLIKYGQFSNFMRGTGIVYLGGDIYNQLVFLSIKTLRSNGSKLPVEVIIPKRSDFDIDLCLRLLPKLNARCKIMSDYLPTSFNSSEVKGYQMKNIAILMSSFENVLYLDADNLPIKNPDPFFSNKPYTNHHMVLWPDLWRRSTSPHYYDIAKIDIDLKTKERNSYFPNDIRGLYAAPNEYSMHDCKNAIPEASSETGQLLINKRVHFKTLILAMYYNFYGPDYYYPLFSQGAAGEGDKETFIAAAHKLGLPYYQVKEFTREFGPINKKTQRHEFFGMGQYDPIVDYLLSNEDHEDAKYATFKGDDGVVKQQRISYRNRGKPTYAKDETDVGKSNYNYHMFPLSNLFFLHANWPKFLLDKMFMLNYQGRGPKEGTSRRRLYGKELVQELGGHDFELDILKNVKWCFCELSNINMQGIPLANSLNRSLVCEQIQEQLTFLQQNPAI